MNINDLVKRVKRNKKAFPYQDTFSDPAHEFFYSTFIKKKSVLVKGEWRNLHQNPRNALILLLDPDTRKAKGKSSPTFSIMTRR